LENLPFTVASIIIDQNSQKPKTNKKFPFAIKITVIEVPKDELFLINYKNKQYFRMEQSENQH
jgi:hypothetical protein